MSEPRKLVRVRDVMKPEVDVVDGLITVAGVMGSSVGLLLAGRLADRFDHSLRRTGVKRRIAAGHLQIFLQRERQTLLSLISFGIKSQNF